MIYSHSFHGIPLQTGDIICTQDGETDSLFGRLWRAFGMLVPGEVDHCLIYLGPGGRCIESAARGVLAFDMPGEIWDSQTLFKQRMLLDRFIGVAYPLQGRSYSPEKEAQIRQAVAAFCLEQATHSRPYNINFLNPQNDCSFYCSQLVYKAYLAQGIDLNSNLGVPAGGLLAKIVFPQEIWNACPHRKPDGGS
jgi:hypothetical protein